MNTDTIFLWAAVAGVLLCAAGNLFLHWLTTSLEEVPRSTPADVSDGVTSGELERRPRTNVEALGEEEQRDTVESVRADEVLVLEQRPRRLSAVVLEVLVLEQRETLASGCPDGDAECAECRRQYFSGTGHPTIALCRACWRPYGRDAAEFIAEREQIERLVADVETIVLLRGGGHVLGPSEPLIERVRALMHPLTREAA